MKEPKWIVTAFDHKVTKASIRQVLKSPDFHDDDFDSREPAKELFLGPDTNGNLIEVLVNYDEVEGRYVVFHAMKMTKQFEAFYASPKGQKR